MCVRNASANYVLLGLILCNADGPDGDRNYAFRTQSGGFTLMMNTDGPDSQQLPQGATEVWKWAESEALLPHMLLYSKALFSGIAEAPLQAMAANSNTVIAVRDGAPCLSRSAGMGGVSDVDGTVPQQKDVVPLLSAITDLKILDAQPQVLELVVDSCDKGPVAQQKKSPRKKRLTRTTQTKEETKEPQDESKAKRRRLLSNASLRTTAAAASVEPLLESRGRPTHSFSDGYF